MSKSLDLSTVKTTGTPREFETGAKRDSGKGKGFYFCIPPKALHRLAQTYEAGAHAYGAGPATTPNNQNWRKGIPVSRLLDSAIRHCYQTLDGQTDEDHLAHAAWNIMCAIETIELVKGGELPAELLDVLQHKKLAEKGVETQIGG